MELKHDPARRLKTIYLAVLALIALIAGFAYVALDRALVGLEDDALTVNVAGRQRMLGERLAHLGRAMADADGADVRDEAFERGRLVIGRLQEAHGALAPAVASLGDARLREDHVGPMIEAFEDLAAGPGPDALMVLFATHARFLERQETIVAALEDHSEALVARSRAMMTGLLTVTLLTLTFVALFVFEPALARLRRLLGEQGRAHERLSDQLERDELTGLANRRRLMRDLEDGDAVEPPARRTLLFLDFDGFKAVNDSLGHETGDALLRSIAGRLRRLAAEVPGLAAYRLSGDEFVLAHTGDGTEESGEALARAAIDRLGAAHRVRGHEIVSGASVGVATGERSGTVGERLLHDADAAMRVSKTAGKGRHTVYDAAMLEVDERRRRIERDLPGAIETGRIGLRYQRLRRLSGRAGDDGRGRGRGGDRDGVEALLHWVHPEFGEIDNRELIDVASAAETVGPLGRHVLATACRELAAHRADGGPALDLHVNVHPAEMRSPGYVGRVVGIVAESGIDPGSVHLECSGGLPARGADETIAVMAELARAGLATGFDDADRHALSLRSLVDTPVRFVKLVPIDDGAVLDAYAGFCRSLGLVVMAKGVETAEALARVERAGFDAVQGHAIGRPATLDEALDETPGDIGTAAGTGVGPDAGEDGAAPARAAA